MPSSGVWRRVDVVDYHQGAKVFTRLPTGFEASVLLCSGQVICSSAQFFLSVVRLYMTVHLQCLL
jgi:hypothetical protein